MKAPDGWIENNGECPVSGETEVLIKLATEPSFDDDPICSVPAGEFDWGSQGGITHYKII